MNGLSRLRRAGLARAVATLAARVRRTERAPRGHGGFTLVELMVTMTVLGLIIVPLCAVTVFFLDHGLQANALFQDDNGARLANVYFSRDVQSATSVDVSSAGCSAGAGDTLVMSLPWTENGVDREASWFTEVSGTTTSLVRHRCTTGALDESQTLATLTSAGSVWFTVTGGNSAPTTVHLGFTNANGLITTLSARPRWATSTATAVPMPPAGVSATSGAGSAVVSWLAPVYDGGSAVTSYAVTASPGGASCATTPPTTTCTLTGLTNGTTYTINVTATNTIGTSQPATTTVGAASAPSAPTNVSATGGDQQAAVTWSAPASDGGSAITSYTATAVPGGASCVTSAPTTACTITGLTNGTTYTIDVTATNAVGTGPAGSTTVSVGRVPDVPTGLTARGYNKKALLSWTAPTFDGGFAISSYTATATPGGNTCLVAYPTTTCTITGLTNGTTYTVSVVATNAKGNSAASNTATVTPEPVPGPPTNVIAGRVMSVTTLAGSGSGSYANGTGSAASFNGPNNLAIDSSGNVFVADTANNRIRKITPAGVVTTFAGSGSVGFVNGTGTSAQFNQPQAIAIDSGNNVFVGDTNNNVIRKITPAGVVTTFAGSSSGTAGSSDGTGTGARFNQLQGLAIDGSDNIWVADSNNNTIRKVTPAAGVSTFAGSGAAGSANGTGTGAQFNWPQGVVVDPSGNVYVADSSNNMIRKITPAGVVTTMAGSGTAGALDGLSTAAQLNGPRGVALDGSGMLYVADSGNNLIRTVDPSGYVATVAGSGAAGEADGTGATATFNFPNDVEIGGDGKIYVADNVGNKVRRIAPVSGDAQVSWTAPAANGGPAPTSYTATSSPGGLQCTTSTTSCIVAGLTNGTAYTFTVTATNSYGVGEVSNPSNSVTPLGVPGVPTNVSAIGGNTNAAVSWSAPASNGGATITSYTATASSGQSCTTASTSCTITGLTNNTNVTVTVYATNILGDGTASSPVTVMPGFVPNAPTNVVAGRVVEVTTLAGSGSGSYANGTGSAASFNGPNNLAIDSAGNLYLADTANNRIRKITPAGVVTTFAGSGTAGFVNGTGTGAQFNVPEAIGIDSSGNLFVGDTGNNVIRKITPAGVVTTFAGSTSGTAGSSDGTGTAARFNGLQGLTIDGSNNIWVADSNNNTIRKVTSSAVVTTFAGSGTAGSANGTGTAAQFDWPQGVAVDSSGNIWVADTNNNMIRKITPGRVVTTLAGSGSSGALDGLSTAARFSGPRGLAIDAAGIIYVADSGNNLIRTVDSSGYVVTVAGSGSAGETDGTATAATFNFPNDVEVGPDGNIYVTDNVGNKVRRIAPVSGGAQVTWTAPSANGGQSPTSYTVTSSPGGITCTSSTTLCTVSGLTNGTAYTFTVKATNGTGTSAASSASNTFTPFAPPGAPTGVSATPGDSATAVSWSAPSSNGGSAITSYTATASSGQTCTTAATSCTITGLTNNVAVTVTVAATNAYGTGASSSPVSVTPGIVPNAPTNVVAGRVAAVTTLAGSGSASYGNGTGTAASFNQPNNLTIDSSGNIYIADTLNNRIRKVTAAGVVTNFAGNGTAGYVNGSGSSAEFDGPQGVTVDSSGNVYVADTNNNRIRKITSGGSVSTLSGNGTAGLVNGSSFSAEFNAPNGLGIDSSGNVYVADTNSNAIRKVTSSGTASTLAGSSTAGYQDATGTSARFSGPQGLVVNSSGTVYVADTNNNRIRKVTSAGVVTTVAGSGGAGTDDGLTTAAEINQPKGLALDPGGTLYVADSANSLIRMVNSSGYVSTVAGSGSATEADGTGANASFNYTVDMAIGSDGKIYVDDSNGNTVRQLTIVSGGAEVTWNAPAANGGQAPTSYTVTSSPGGITCSSSTTWCTLTGLTNGTAYTFKVTATNGTGTGAASSASNSFTPATLPGAPTNANAATAGSHNASVSWTAPASNGGAAVLSYRVTSSSGNHTCTTASNTCTVSGLTSGQAYTFTVTATNTIGTGSASSATNSITAT